MLEARHQVLLIKNEFLGVYNFIGELGLLRSGQKLIFMRSKNFSSLLPTLSLGYWQWVYHLVLSPLASSFLKYVCTDYFDQHYKLAARQHFS